MHFCFDRYEVITQSSVLNKIRHSSFSPRSVQITGILTDFIFYQLHNCVLLFFFSYRQLILIIELYNHRDVYDYLRHIALTLCSDKVSEVRWISYKLVSLQEMGFVERHV